MTDMQNKLLDMFVWFDSFCRENSLVYYAIGGTLLGAVRHKGFIPWDDDIDVGMPRKDYEQLASIMGDTVIDSYVLETENSQDEKYCYPYSKLYDTRTTLCENVKTKLVRGIYIDIFPLDGLGCGKAPDMKWYSKIKKKNQLYLSRISNYRKGRSLYKNLAVLFMNCIPNCILNDKKLRQTIGTMCKKYDFEASDWVGNLLGNWWEREIYPADFLGNPKEYEFEGHNILSVEKSDEFLKAVYGNWRELPPKEKQITHHDYLFCDLDHSYLNRNEEL